MEFLTAHHVEYLNNKNITNFDINYSGLDFLKDEPDLYSVNDLRKKYINIDSN